MPNDDDDDRLRRSHSRGMDRLENKMDELMSAWRAQSTVTATLVTQTANMQRDIEILNGIVRDGNGTLSLTVRMAAIETRLESRLDSLDEQFEKFWKSDQERDAMARARDAENQRWRAGLVWSAVIAVVASLLAMLGNYLWH